MTEAIVRALSLHDRGVRGFERLVDAVIEDDRSDEYVAMSTAASAMRATAPMASRRRARSDIQVPGSVSRNV